MIAYDCNKYAEQNTAYISLSHTRNDEDEEENRQYEQSSYDHDISLVAENQCEYDDNENNHWVHYADTFMLRSDESGASAAML